MEKKNRLFSIVFVSMFVLSAFLGMLGTVPEKANAVTEFSPPHVENAVDTGGDGLYNLLVLKVNVSVDSHCYCSIYGNITDSFSTEIDTNRNWKFLESGFNIVELRFLGMAIYNNNVDGPYTINLELRDPVLLDTDTHITAAYPFTAFQDQEPQFSPPHNDTGYDSDGDSFYNELVIRANVTAVETGTYLIQAGLILGVGGHGQSKNEILSVGTQVIEFRFDGLTIYQSGIDGPYTVHLNVGYDYLIEVDSDTHLTEPYLHTEFEPPGATFSPPHYEDVLDTDGDAKYNYLIIYVNVTVDEAGIYGIDASPSFGGGTESKDDLSLDVGDHTIEFRFSGVAIYNSGTDGPYSIQLHLRDDSMVPAHLDSDTYMTNPYQYTDFDPPGATFLPPHKDSVIDTDVDGKFDYLVVDVNVSVAEAGDYRVGGNIWIGGALGGPSASGTLFLGTGVTTVELKFPGGPILLSGTNGPYEVHLSIYDDDGNSLDTDIHVTAAYIFSDFETQAEFSPPHFDYASDLNNDGQDDYLMVNVNVSIDLPGNYAIMGMLYDETFNFGITIYVAFETLNAGLHTVSLYFNGKAINEQGIDGPYGVELRLVLQHPEFGGTMDFELYTTNPYLASQFASTDVIPPSVVSTMPSDGETGVSTTSDIYILFSERMNETTVAGAFSYTDGVTTWDSGDGSFGCSFNYCGFNPSQEFIEDVTYTVTLSTSAEDFNGNNLLSPYVFSFTVSSPQIHTGGGNITGTVVDVNSGPVAGANVTLMNATGTVAFASTNATGDYRFSSIASGDYTILVTKDGYLDGTNSTTVSTGLTTAAGPIVLAENGRICGTVKDDGGVVADATVELFHNGVQAKAFTTNSTGGFAFANLTYGNYTIKVTKSGYKDGEQKLELKNGADMTPELELTINKLSSGGGLGDYWWAFLIIALVAVGIVAFFMMRKRGMGASQTPSDEGATQAAESEEGSNVSEEASPSALVCASCGQALESEYVMCPNCGNKI
jgi:hypothetical protein